MYSVTSLSPAHTVSSPGKSVQPFVGTSTLASDAIALPKKRNSSIEKVGTSLRAISPAISEHSNPPKILETSVPREIDAGMASRVEKAKISSKDTPHGLLRRRRFSALSKSSSTKSNLTRLVSFSRGDDLAFQALRLSPSHGPVSHLPQDHIFVEDNGPRPEAQRSAPDSSPPQDSDESSSSGELPSSRTSLDSRGGQGPEGSTGNKPTKRSASQESGGSSGGNGSGDSEDERSIVRPAKKAKVALKKPFACPYHKHDPQSFGIHALEKRFRVCQDSGYVHMADLRSVCLLRIQKINFEKRS
jgi:hypothetical protein